MPPSKHTNREITLTLDFDSAERKLFANKFLVELDNGHIITHFGYQSQRGPTASVVSVCLNTKSLREQYKQNSQYLLKVADMIDENGDSSHEYYPSQACGEIIAADLCQLARTDKFAEISFFFISFFQMIRHGKSNSVLKEKEIEQPKASCPLILRCDLNMQVRWLEVVYEKLGLAQ